MRCHDKGMEILKDVIVGDGSDAEVSVPFHASANSWKICCKVRKGWEVGEVMGGGLQPLSLKGWLDIGPLWRLGAVEPLNSNDEGVKTSVRCVCCKLVMSVGQWPMKYLWRIQNSRIRSQLRSPFGKLRNHPSNLYDVDKIKRIGRPLSINTRGFKGDHRPEKRTCRKMF